MISRRAFIGPAILLVAIVVGYPVYWLYAAALGETLIVDWIDQQRRQGRVVNHGPIEKSGFPLLVRLEILAPESVNLADGFSWRSERLRIDLRPWDLQRLRLEATGAQQLQLKSTADALDMTVNATGAEGVVLLARAGGLTALSLILRDVRATDAEQGQILRTDRILADFAQPDRPPIAHTETALEMSLAAEDIELARIDAPLLGKTIGSLRVKAEVLGPLQGETIARTLSQWRDSGGTLEVRWLNLVWGALDLRANGTVALDERMRPLGALTADIRGYEETLEALAEAEILRRDILPASRVTLNLLARTDPNDGRRVLTVPLTAQDGALFLGPIKLSEIPEVTMSLRNRPSARQD
jgi:hypothetical protein